VSRKHTIEFIREKFGEDEYECLSEEYINAKSKLNYICPKGHVGTITWDNWNHGKRCPICSGSKKLTIGFVKLEFEKEGWICTSNAYINNFTRLNYICPNGHVGTITWDNWMHRRSCPRCNKTGTSLWEGTIKQFVKLLDIPFLENDRTLILNPDTNRFVELDLWFPNLSKAIECNSVYWHKKRKHIDILKREWCRDNNVGLLNIDFEDWENDIKKCQKKIEKFLN
jgi:hypothetical protein